MAEEKQIVSEILSYLINVIEPERDEFSGFATCPFSKAERTQNKVWIAKFDMTKVSMLDMVEGMLSRGHESGLFALFENDLPINMEPEETKKFQTFINSLLGQAGYDDYKSVCFNPNDQVEVQGFNPRSSAPYFLINIAKREVLEKANKSLKKTKYYAKMPSKYRKFLNVDL